MKIKKIDNPETSPLTSYSCFWTINLGWTSCTFCTDCTRRTAALAAQAAQADNIMEEGHDYLNSRSPWLRQRRLWLILKWLLTKKKSFKLHIYYSSLYLKKNLSSISLMFKTYLIFFVIFLFFFKSIKQNLVLFLLSMIWFLCVIHLYLISKSIKIHFYISNCNLLLTFFSFFKFWTKFWIFI